MTVFTGKSTDFVEVMPDVVRYKAADDWGANFVMFDVVPGAYKSDRPVLICTQQIGYARRNRYYSEKLGIDTYAGPTPSSIPFSITENAKLGFSLPQGEGEIHPLIVRVL